ncbi:MAG: acyltransferase family protein [Actinomycetota bacterium]
MSTQTRIREVDGLRAVAVLLVVGHHSGLRGFSGGYFGVDVFFVISGFVITLRVLSDLDDDGFSVLDFYRRRVRRILPALLTVLALTTYLAHKWLLPADYARFAEMLKATLTLQANTHVASQTDYFSPDTAFMPIAHLWSLAIEEQFYLVFPLCVYLMMTRRRLTFLIATAFAVSVLWMLFGATTSPTSYFSAVNRVGQLTLGALCAVGVAQRSSAALCKSRCREHIGAIALLLLIGLVPVFSAKQAVPSPMSLVPVALVALVLVSPRHGLVTGLMCWKPLQLIGLASFSIYLVHQPLMAYARTVVYGTPYSFPTLTEQVLLIVASIVLGIVSWKVVEEPTRRSRGIYELSVVLCVVLGGLFLYGHANRVIDSEGLPERIPPEFVESVRRRDVAMASNGVVFHDNCVYSGQFDELSMLMSQNYLRCSTELGAPIMVVGDSHAEDLFNALALNLNKRHIIGVFRGELAHAEFAQLLATRLQTSQWQPRAVLFTLEASTWIANNRVDQALLDHDARDIARALRQIPVAAWLGPQLEPRVDLFSFNPLVGTVREQNTLRLSERLSEEVDTALRTIAESAELQYISKQEIIAFSYRKDFEIAEGYTYSDRTHWSSVGEKYFGGKLLQSAEIRRLLASE